MAIYYIGKSQREIENLNVFAGSETIFGMNENENYSSFSLADEEKNLKEKDLTKAKINLRFGMEKFKIFDSNAKFIFSDQALFDEVMKFSEKDMAVSSEDVKVVEDLSILSQFEENKN